MKKLLIFVLVSVPLASSYAGEVALVYQDQAAVSAGKPWLGTLTPEGVLISAEQALEAKMEPLVGFLDGTLRAGSLVRLDNELNVALIEPKENVSDEALINAHRTRAVSFASFLPVQKDASLNALAPAGVGGKPVLASTEPFGIQINGQWVGSDPVVLTVKKKQSDFRLKVINQTGNKIWQISVRLESDPPVSFWRKGKKRDLNDIPRKVFRASQQKLLVPLRPGRSFEMSVEAFHMKEEFHTWTATVEAKKKKKKKIAFTKQFPVRFQYE